MNEYLVHNVAASPLTRALRLAHLAARGVSIIYLPVTQKRVYPGQAVPVHAEYVKQHLEFLKRHVNMGLLQVTNAFRQPVDLDAEDLKTLPTPAEPPPANFPLDSVERDDNPQRVLPSSDDQPLPPTDYKWPVTPSPASLNVDNEDPSPEGDDTFQDGDGESLDQDVVDPEAEPPQEPSLDSEPQQPPPVAEQGKKKKGK